MSMSMMERVAQAMAIVPTISLEEAAAMMDQDDVLVVDVREDAELAESGKVKGALHVPLATIELRADDTGPQHDRSFSKDKTIIVYCGSGGRSALAGKALLDLGYRDVRNLGGFNAWRESGRPVE